MAKPKNVCIGNINPGNLSLGFVTSLMETLGDEQDVPHEDRLVRNVLLRRSGPYLDQGRNKLVDDFLKKTDCEWLLFIDSDISWKPQDIRKLVTSANEKYKPVVSGVYYSPFPKTDLSNGGNLPVVYRWGKKEQHGATTITFVNDNWEKDEWPKDRLFKVDSFGAGFLLIHRGLLMKMIEKYGYPAPWFLCQVVNEVMMGEDHLFCLRVAHMGYSLYVHTGVQVGHHKGADF